MAIDNDAYGNFNCPRQDLFDTWTPESAYLLGLLYADGHLDKEGRIISFHSTDYQLIDLVVNLIGYQGTISEQSYMTKQGQHTKYTITFGGPITGRVEEIGLPRGDKSTKLVWPPTLPSNVARDFVRGFFDGDGGTQAKPYGIAINFASGSLPLLQAIEYVARNLGCWTKKPQYCTNPAGSCYNLQYGDKVEAALLAMYMYLYPTTDLCLHRKRDTIFGWFEIEIPDTPDLHNQPISTTTFLLPPI